MAIVVYVPAIAMSQGKQIQLQHYAKLAVSVVTGINVIVACAIIFVVCIFYTAIGGIKAVMWTDAFQVQSMH